MLVYAFVFLIIVLAYFYLKRIVIPQRRIKWYKKTIQALGYRIYQTKFTPRSLGIVPIWKKDDKERGDSRYTMKKQLKNYDLILTNILDQEAIFLLNPELIKDFYQSKKQIEIYSKDYSGISNLVKLLGSGIAFSQGESWKKKRKIITSVFNFEFLKSIIPKICSITDNRIEYEESKWNFQNGQKKMNIYLENLFAAIFSNVMVQCFFGSSLRGEKIEGMQLFQFLSILIKDIAKQGSQLIGFFLGHWFFNLGIRKKDRLIKKRTKFFRLLCKSVIDKRIQQIKREGPKQAYDDIIEALMRKQFYTENKTKNAEQYDYKELIDQFSTFYLAGTDTTAHFNTMLIYYLCLHPNVMQKVRAEIDQHIKTQKDYNYQNLKAMNYIDWVQNQTTRLYGPLTGLFIRKSAKDHYILNIPILKNSFVSIFMQHSHFNPNFYQNPQQFRPERWESECSNIHPYAFMGFSAGPRTCIGKQLALLQSKITIIKMLKRYKNITIPKNNFKMKKQFLYQPEYMLTQLTLE